MIWEINLPWNRINDTSKYGVSKTPNPIRLPTKLVREIINKKVKLTITDQGKDMNVKIEY